MKFKVNLKTPGILITINKLQIRTPTSIIIDDKDLKQYKNKFKSLGIFDYYIEDFKSDQNIMKEQKYNIITRKDPEKKEDKKETFNSLLESFLDE